MSKKKGRGSFITKLVLAVIIVAIGVGVWIGWGMYQQIYRPNVSLQGKTTQYFFIPTGSTIQDVTQRLFEGNYIINKSSFEWVAERKNYAKHVKPGRYLLKADMNNNDLVDLLRSGEQVPVDVTFNTVRTKKELAGKVGGYLEADSSEIAALLHDPQFAARYGFNTNTFLTMFLPNTYEFFWNTSAEDFIARMAKEYKAFWNADRIAKANAIGLSQSEVSILASIVQAEQSVFRDERPRVAGLYINRLKKGMRLESDPTLVYGLGDFTIRRVWKKHKNIDSPYNTYKNDGLPPGPINLPEISSIDAVLNYERHDYIFMCAKPDFSGYHNFAKSYRQHQVNARKYQRELDRRRIMK